MYVILVLGVTVAGLRIWVYPWWNRRNAIKVARQWMLAGKPAYAAEAVQEAINAAPDNPEVWRLASDLARLSGRKAMEVEFARRAAELGPASKELKLEWASAALRADMSEEAERALDKLSPEELAGSAFGLRLRGELERRRGQFSPAQSHFEAALHLDGPVAADEVPLGIILLGSTDSSLRQRGLDLLGKWAPDREWGANALRALLGDALRTDDRAAMLKWAGAMQAHPDCKPGDMPNCLLAYARADETRFKEVVTRLEHERAADPVGTALLLGWFNQIGRSQEGVRWLDTLPVQNLRHPPLVVVAAESLRQTADWNRLRTLVKEAEWTPDVEFIGWTYEMEAARALGYRAEADEAWRSLANHAQLNGVHALFAGSTLFGWGHEKEAEILWWKAAEQNGRVAIDALGTLARFYQVRRDAEGEYRVFDRLFLLHPKDAAVANNYAFFAALCGHQQLRAEQVAKDNLAKEPDNPTYLATYAFALFVRGKAGEALALLKPAAAGVRNSKALAFAYGLTLTGTGQKAAGAALLASLDPSIMTTREIELIKASSGN